MTERGRTVVLFRHGLAEEKGTRPDAERTLTDEGHARMKEIAAGLAAFLDTPDEIFTSPLVRCVETAEWLARAWQHKVSVRETDALRPGAGSEAFRTFLATAGDAACIVCVGHEPDLTALMLDLSGARVDGEVELKKGGCYGLRVPASGPAQLKWMLPPRILSNAG